MDLYPEELGLQLRASNTETATERQNSREDTIVFFRPPRYYADRAEEVVVEKIPIPTSSPGASRQYSFIVTDSYGDGMCCNWVGKTETGYTLYEGDRKYGKVIVDSKFEGSSREVNTFTIEGPAITEPTESPDSDVQEIPSEPQPLVEIKVTITLDVFPDETGFYIEDESGEKVVDVTPGTYKEQNQVVEEILTLEVGVYTFTIVDVFGDGLNRENSFYRLNLVGEEGRPALVAGTGIFVKQESQVFMVEGPSAKYPMAIKFTTNDKAREFGFFIKRLDLLESDALVASIPRGTYRTKDQDVSESVMVKEGGLYRIVFEAGQDGIGFDIHIIMGSKNPNDVNALSYRVDTTESQEWQVKLFAGTLPVTSDGAKSLDLRVQFDRFPHELEWILLGNISRDNPVELSRALREQEVIAYGPPASYSQELAGTVYVETIPLPAHSGEKSFTMIVTDAAGDGSK